jgi:hypothetical protein
MPPTRCHRLLLLMLLALAGCISPIQHGNGDLLKPAQMSPDSSVVDVFIVRLPSADPNVKEKLWETIDEQHFPIEVRERLANNGFRAGVVMGEMPVALFNLLELSNKPAPNGKIEQTTTTTFEESPNVVLQHLQLPSKQRAEILTSDIIPQVTVFVSDHGLCGQVYRQAQCLFSLKLCPQADGNVRFDVVPELHHDQPKPQWSVSQGVTHIDFGRPRQVFDDMTISANLPIGAMIVLSSLPNKPGSLGHQFFNESKDSVQQKLLVIRLSQTQYSGLFSEEKKAEPPTL